VIEIPGSEVQTQTKYFIMKTRFYFFVLAAGIMLQVKVSGQPREIKAETKISEVTVYTRGARIFCEKKVELPAGNSVIKFTGIASEIDQQSLQVTAEGSVMILTVNHEIDYMTDADQNAAQRILEKQRELLVKKCDKEKMQIEILDKEMLFLQANMKVTGTNTTTKVAELAPVYDYFVSKTTDITTGKKWRNDSIQAWTEQINRINKQIGDLQTEQKRPAGIIAVSIDAPEKTAVLFKINYVIANAGWFPSYDIRVKNIESPVQLTYKANLFQRSGIDWKEVTLRFSSSNMFQTGILPELNPWWLDIQRPQPIMIRGAVQSQDAMYMKSVKVMDQVREETAAMPLPVIASDQLTTVEFTVGKPLTVLANGKNLLVDIQNVTIPADYTYLSVPKLDLSAHLKAKLTNWEQYNLMAGEATVYYEGTFTGKTYLNTRDFSDTLEISLGIDHNISIQRTLEKEFSSTRFLASKTESAKSWKLTVKNNKSQKINITLLDQVPLSANSDIEVSDMQLSGGKLEAPTGVVTWELVIKPAEKTEKKLSYTVRYPKGKKINLD
jgi:uncharacterized protein (TIGR02231 family)